MLKSILVIVLFASTAYAQMDMSHMNHEGMEGMTPAEHEKMMNQVSIPVEKQQMIGVKTAIAQVRTLKKIIRTVGTVAYDPDLYTAQNEYVQAVSAGDEELAAAARLNLRRLGLSDALISNLEGADPSLLIGSKNGLVWIYGKIYESDLPLVKKGMMIHVTSKNLPGAMFMGNIASIDSVLDEMTRSLKIRAAVKNEDGQLKPNMYVDVMIEVSLGKKLAIPEEAVLDTGEKQIVFIVKGKGIFEKREVEIGQRAEGFIEVLGGVKAGEKVVTSGNFLIDSESKIKSTGGGGHHH